MEAVTQLLYVVACGRRKEGSKFMAVFSYDFHVTSVAHSVSLALSSVSLLRAVPAVSVQENCLQLV